MGMVENSANSKPYRIMQISFMALLLITLVIALVPSWREQAQNILWPRERLILAKSQAQINPNGIFVTVVKIKTKMGLFIEIYKSKNVNESMEFWIQFPLEGTQDSFFNFHSQASNLVLTDVDSDGFLDIMAPTYDEQQQARMNIFRFDETLGTFIRMERE